ADVDRDGVSAQLAASGGELVRRSRSEGQREPLVPQHPRDRQADARGATGHERRAHARESRRNATAAGGRRPSRVRGRGCVRSPLRPTFSAPSAVLLPRLRTLGYVTEIAQLTSLARAGGCAAKYSASRLETLLAGLVTAGPDDLIVGLDPADDAAV